jgi:hypothetical protein
MDLILHTGLGHHPNLLPIVVTAIVAFAAGTGIGAFCIRPDREADGADTCPSEQ